MSADVISFADYRAYRDLLQEFSPLVKDAVRKRHASTLDPMWRHIGFALGGALFGKAVGSFLTGLLRCEMHTGPVGLRDDATRKDQVP